MRRLGVLALAVLALTGCGEDPDADAPQLIVSAAASLKAAFTQYGERFSEAKARFSFAGSDALGAQIRQGVRPDVYAAASTQLPEALHADGLVEEPQVFAANELVLAVAAGSRRVGSLADLGGDGVTLAVGQEDVPPSDTAPVGFYLAPGARASVQVAPPLDEFLPFVEYMYVTPIIRPWSEFTRLVHPSLQNVIFGEQTALPLIIGMLGMPTADVAAQLVLASPPPYLAGQEIDWDYVNANLASEL